MLPTTGFQARAPDRARSRCALPRRSAGAGNRPARPDGARRQPAHHSDLGSRRLACGSAFRDENWSPRPSGQAQHGPVRAPCPPGIPPRGPGGFPGPLAPEPQRAHRRAEGRVSGRHQRVHASGRRETRRHIPVLRASDTCAPLHSAAARGGRAAWLIRGRRPAQRTAGEAASSVAASRSRRADRRPARQSPARRTHRPQG